MTATIVSCRCRTAKIGQSAVRMKQDFAIGLKKWEVNIMMMIDIPQVAYKTWKIEYIVRNEDGTRNQFLERELEDDLKKALPEYRYSSEHDHVR